MCTRERMVARYAPEVLADDVVAAVAQSRRQVKEERERRRAGGRDKAEL